MALSIVTKRHILNPGDAADPSAVFRQFGGVCVGGLTLPMPPAQVGGDSVGAVAVADGFVSFVTDAQGKGTMASRLGTVMRQCVLSSISGGTISPTGILQKLNRTLLGEGILGAAAILHCDGRRMTASVAGSPAPALFHPDGKMELLPITGTILGLSPSPEFDRCVRDILPSAFVAIFSDGVTEAEAPDGELFAVERFGALLDRGQSMASNLLRCVDAILAHSGRQQDDLSLVIAHADGLPGAHVHTALGTTPQQRRTSHLQQAAACSFDSSGQGPIHGRTASRAPSRYYEINCREVTTACGCDLASLDIPTEHRVIPACLSTPCLRASRTRG